MKPILLSLALLPLLLTGCASSGYVGDYPGYYGPGYYDGPTVGVAYYNGGYGYNSGYHSNYYHANNYHHYSNNNYHHAYASNNVSHGSYHSHGSYASAGSGHSGGNHTASASAGSPHIH